MKVRFHGRTFSKSIVIYELYMTYEIRELSPYAQAPSGGVL